MPSSAHKIEWGIEPKVEEQPLNTDVTPLEPPVEETQLPEVDLAPQNNPFSSTEQPSTAWTPNFFNKIWINVCNIVLKKNSLTLYFSPWICVRSLFISLSLNMNIWIY